MRCDSSFVKGGLEAKAVTGCQHQEDDLEFDELAEDPEVACQSERALALTLISALLAVGRKRVPTASTTL